MYVVPVLIRLQPSSIRMLPPHPAATSNSHTEAVQRALSQRHTCLLLRRRRHKQPRKSSSSHHHRRWHQTRRPMHTLVPASQLARPTTSPRYTPTTLPLHNLSSLAAAHRRRLLLLAAFSMCRRLRIRRRPTRTIIIPPVPAVTAIIMAIKPRRRFILDILLNNTPRQLHS